MSRNTLSRRSVVGGLAASGLAIALSARRAPSMVVLAQDAPEGPFTLPALSYDYAALEPHIDTLTMQIHHDKHHATYVGNLNKAVVDHSDLQAMSAEDLIKNLDAVPEEIRSAIRNNAGGHVNHTMYWEIMGGTGAPTGAIADAIGRDFGDLATLQEAVNKAGTGRFGSGWAWVVLKDGKLAVTSTPNQDNPLMDASGSPILGVDVWEHAYYLKYQNKRADYLTAWWNVVNWEAVGSRYAAAGGL
jgi:Fe-Mn family superoxide dismutase